MPMNFDLGRTCGAGVSELSGFEILTKFECEDSSEKATVDDVTEDDRFDGLDLSSESLRLFSCGKLSGVAASTRRTY